MIKKSKALARFIENLPAEALIEETQVTTLTLTAAEGRSKNTGCTNPENCTGTSNTGCTNSKICGDPVIPNPRCGTTIINYSGCNPGTCMNGVSCDILDD